MDKSTVKVVDEAVAVAAAKVPEESAAVKAAEEAAIVKAAEEIAFAKSYNDLTEVTELFKK